MRGVPEVRALAEVSDRVRRSQEALGHDCGAAVQKFAAFEPSASI
jgi:hypothetical protein